MNEGIQLDLFKARELRDEGVDRVLDNEYGVWKGQYRALVEHWFETIPIDTVFLGEKMRVVAKDGGIEDPHHPNCWSGMSRSLLHKWLKEERIVVSGYAQSLSVANCAHTYRAYKKVA